MNSRRQCALVSVCTFAAFAMVPLGAVADGVTPLGKVDVTGHYDNSVGSSDAASAGVITPQLIEDRPLLRPGNLLEYVPGMVVTQHSGAGKANQYFLRGFNLDHGTDFATWVAGMPVNLRTHAHGQGYTDLNFIIPELISRVDYWKGPYYANIGDFGSAGGALHALLGQPEGRHRRSAPAATSATRARCWPAPRLRARACSPTASNTCTTTDRGTCPTTSASTTRCCATWCRSATGRSASPQWPTAASGTRPTRSRSARSTRASSAATARSTTATAASRSATACPFDYSTPLAGGQFQTTAYWFKYKLNLFSNFTYFLDDPVNGDQFEQADDRNVYGWTGSWSKSGELVRRADDATRWASNCGRTASIRSASTRRGGVIGCRRRAKTP